MDAFTTKLIANTELQVPSAAARVTRLKLIGRTDRTIPGSDRYRVDLCLTPRSRNARACFTDRWNPGRFEPIGALFVLPPNETVRAVGEGNALFTTVVCELPLQRMVEQEDIRWTNRRLEAGLNVQNEALNDLMVRLASALDNPGFAGALVVEGIANNLAVEICRYFGSLREVPVTSGLAPWRLRLIDERLNEVSAAPTLYELAELCKLSIRHLSRAFFISRGSRLGDYVAARQMDHAKRLLQDGATVKFTAFTLGFNSTSSFCYSFRRESGVTPREYLQRSVAS